MRVRAAIVLATLLESATALAQPTPWQTAEPVTESYRYQTLAVDALGLGLLVAGGIAEGDGGRDTETSEALFTAGGLTMMFGAPIVHGVRGHGGRAVRSTLMRGGLAGLGMLAAMGVRSGCDGFLCQLDYVGYGLLGGFALAAVLDATYNTDEVVETRWAPQVAATPDGGVRAGIALAW